MSTIAIMQPHFLPFAGYFDLLRRADMFIYYDTAQLRRRSWHCRTFVRQGDTAAFLTAPVKGGSRQRLLEVDFDDEQPWRARALQRLRHTYNEVPDHLADLLLTGPTKLVDWNIAGVSWLADELGLKPLTVRVSALHTPPDSSASQRLVWMCRRLSAGTYLATPGARGYLDESAFEAAGIEVQWLRYDYPHRLRGPNSTPVVPSILDLLLTAGTERARAEIGLIGVPTVKRFSA